MMTESEVHEFSAARAAEKGYVLSTGDVFDVQFLFQRTLNTRVTVRPDGFVALPVVGEVACSGRTPAQLDSVLTEAYATYYRDPEVTINVLIFAPPSVYVLGEVRNQKAVKITPGMSMLQALADAGGSTPGANLGSAVLLRRVSDEQAYAQRVDLSKFLKGKGNA
ncbi:MAG: hypothetical protein HKN21_00435, partial [Candidatus Eisenbacteria bacterium]|nr:hypothetical protein [Candidatus Eisenbacteria bacterium]